MNMGMIMRCDALILLVTGWTCFQHAASFKTEVQIMAEIQSMAAGIMTECTYQTTMTQCDYAKRTVDYASSIKTMCSAMDVYIRCQDTNCGNQSAAFIQILTDAMVIPYCADMVYFPLGPGFQDLATRVSQMAHLCIFSPGRNCDMAQNNFLKSGNRRYACWAMRYYAVCLVQSCSSPSDELLRMITEAKNDTACEQNVTASTDYAHNPGFTLIPRTSTTTTQGFTLIPTTGTTSTRELHLDQSTISTITKGITAESIQLVADQIMDLCADPTFIGGCSWSKGKVDTATSVAAVCAAMDTYVLCQERNCFTKSPKFTNILADSKNITVCGWKPALTENTQVNMIVHGVIGMVRLCNFSPGHTCSIQQETVLTSSNYADVCRAETYYTDCLTQNCSAPSTELRSLIISARDDPLCNRCDYLQVSGLLLLMTAVIRYLRPS